MQDGRMTSQVSVQLFGPDGTLKQCVGKCPCEDDCPENCCGESPRKDESNG